MTVALVLVTAVIAVVASRMMQSRKQEQHTALQNAPMQEESGEAMSISDEGTASQAEPVSDGETADDGQEASADVPMLELTDAQMHTGDLILINADHPYVFEDNPEDALVYIAQAQTIDYPLAEGDLRLNARIMPALDAMIDACNKTLNVKDTGISSAYRTKQIQQSIWDMYEGLYGVDYCERYVATPGYSEHHTGLAADMTVIYEDGFEDSFSVSDNAVWMNDHCMEYGFVRRFQEHKTEITGISNEAWHFRYVGVPHAVYMTNEDLCLEEYIDALRETTAEEPLLVSCAEGEYQIYFTSERSIPEPEHAYTVSGNNVDGFIITERVGDPS